MAFTIIDQGSFTSAGVGVKVNLPSSADYFRVQNLTQLATQQTPGRGVMFEWYKDLTAADTAIEWAKEDGDDITNITLASSGGFTYVESFPEPEAAVTGGTAITSASPAVVTLANSYSEGDTVILYNTTGMLQIGGMSFTISSVSGAGFTLLGLDSSGFAAATACTARRVPNVMAVEPSYLYVTGISQATQAVVTVSMAHNYVVGQKLTFSVPSSFGMSEISGKTGTIVSVGTYTMTVDIDSSAFTAFAFPASTGSPTTRLFATVAPAGQSTQYNPVTGVQTGYNFQFAPFHSGLFLPYMYLAAGAQSPAGSSSDVIVWQAFKKE